MFFTLIIAGLVEGLNPCSLAVLFIFLFVLSIQKISSAGILLYGLAFTGSMFMANFLLCFGWLSELRQLNLYFMVSKSLAWGIAVLSLGIGALSFADWGKCLRAKKAVDFSIPWPRFSEDLSLKHGSHGDHPLRSVVFLILTSLAGLISVAFQAGARDQMFFPVWSELIRSPRLIGESVFFIGLYSLMFVVPFVLSVMVLRYAVSSPSFVSFIKTHPSKLKIVHAAVFLGVGMGLIYILK